MLQSLNFLFNMGEYGYFVWPAYGIFFIVLFGLMIESKYSLKKAKKEKKVLNSLFKELDVLKKKVEKADQSIKAFKIKIEKYNNSIFIFILKYFINSIYKILFN